MSLVLNAVGKLVGCEILPTQQQPTVTVFMHRAGNKIWPWSLVSAQVQMCTPGLYLSVHSSA